MKKTLLFIIPVALLFLIASCEKENYTIKGTANITVINAALNAGSIKVNAGAGNGFAYAKASDVAFGGNAIYGAFTGSTPITVVSSTDTTKVLFSRTVDLQPISTLYIAGLSPTIDTVFRVEKSIPVINNAVLKPDSSVYIRFVNLSPNSTPLNINVRLATTNEVTGLAYKGISELKKYAAKTSSTTYTFEIRDAATNVVQSTLNFNATNNRYKTITIVIRGLMVTGTGTTAFGTFQVNHVG
ncbi:DUF4397 domain-containing protein [Pedobacter westerhofensis]|nr:DUF4397 domain-containing protein [Pedobacter westerhofensis]